MPPPDSPTPEEEARLRRLLAQSRAQEPMPDDVARRLDDTLVELAAERDAGDVVPLDHRRRRRRTLAGLLAAAAVVVVAGVGVGEVLRSGDDDALQSTRGDAASAPARSAEEGADEGAQGQSLDQASEDAASSNDGRLKRREVQLEVHDGPWLAPEIGEQRLERDALRVRRALPQDAIKRYDRAVLWAPTDFTCESADWGAGVFVGVQYAGSNAVLALREPSQQNQVVEVLQCGTGESLRSVTVAAP